MYAPMSIEEVDYYLKPMNCPGHIMIYKSQVRSYRDLPLRFAELGTVYRYERSGTLHGMLRVRGFTQDDAHIFCRPEQIDRRVGWGRRLRDVFRPRLRLRRPGLPGDAARKGDRRRRDVGARDRRAARRPWNRGASSYKIDAGGGAFYGPKIDVKWVDALGREWTGPTIQADFNLPERFDVTYVGEDGERHRAVMIHRTLLGSMERFVGGLIEHYAGAFPVWLAPVQATIIPITDDQIAFARGVSERLAAAGMRVDVDDQRDRMQAKIRNAQLQKMPVHARRRQARGREQRRLRSPPQRRGSRANAGRRFRAHGRRRDRGEIAGAAGVDPIRFDRRCRRLDHAGMSSRAREAAEVGWIRLARGNRQSV